MKEMDTPMRDKCHFKVADVLAVYMLAIKYSLELSGNIHCVEVWTDKVCNAIYNFGIKSCVYIKFPSYICASIHCQTL